MKHETQSYDLSTKMCTFSILCNEYKAKSIYKHNLLIRCKENHDRHRICMHILWLFHLKHKKNSRLLPFPSLSLDKVYIRVSNKDLSVGTNYSCSADMSLVLYSQYSVRLWQDSTFAEMEFLNLSLLLLWHISHCCLLTLLQMRGGGCIALLQVLPLQPLVLFELPLIRGNLQKNQIALASSFSAYYPCIGCI